MVAVTIKGPIYYHLTLSGLVWVSLTTDDQIFLFSILLSNPHWVTTVLVIQ